MDLSVLAEDPYPAIALVGGGIISIFISVYGNREDSHLDELATYGGFVLGVVIGIMAFFVAVEGTVLWFTLAVMILLAVTLFLKPMKDLPWAGVVGLIAGLAAAYAVSLFLPSSVTGTEFWAIMVVVFLIVGAIVHVIFHFLEDVLKITRMILDWRPVMVLVGLIAVVEGVLLFFDTSIITLF